MINGIIGFFVGTAFAFFIVWWNSIQPKDYTGPK